MTLQHTDPLARELLHAIQSGDLQSLQRLLSQNPGLAQARIERNKGSSTPLHAVTDWPGFFPNGPASVRALLDAGADPNATTLPGDFKETPLHYAASTDDLEVAAALLDGGASLEINGGSIAGGTPLENAVGYGCWHVALLLLARGAKATKLWHAAALGPVERVEAFFTGPAIPSPKEINDAFWQACHAGCRRTAEFLLARGADLNWVPDYAKQTPLAIATHPGTARQLLASWLKEKGAKDAENK